MSFKTEYHVDVSFLHDLVTMGHSAKASSAEAKIANKKEEKWARSKRLSEDMKERKKAEKRAWHEMAARIDACKQDKLLDDDMKEAIFQAAKKCDLSLTVDTFKIMWNNLNYDNKKMIQAYFHAMNAVYSDNREKTQNPIPLKVLNFIDADVFETLLKCIVTDFNSHKFDPVYLTKIANLAISKTFQEVGAFVRIWEQLNLDAQNHLISYFSTNSNFNEQLKLCTQLKSDEERRRERQDAISRMREPGILSIEKFIDNTYPERL
jgi:hypothetical protein